MADTITSTTTTVLWLSRHAMSAEQEADLKVSLRAEALQVTSEEVTFGSDDVAEVEKLWLRAIRQGIAVVAGVFPASMAAEIGWFAASHHGNQHGVKFAIPKMKPAPAKEGEQRRTVHDKWRFFFC